MVSHSTTDIDIRRKRLIFRSWHRGAREIDLLLGPFADRYVSGFNTEELDQYEALLEEQDPDIYDWLTGRSFPPDNLNSSIMLLLKSFHNQPK